MEGEEGRWRERRQEVEQEIGGNKGAEKVLNVGM